MVVLCIAVKYIGEGAGGGGGGGGVQNFKSR